MEYRSLSKIFYADSSTERFANNERLARERLEAESTFRTGVIGPNGEFFLAVPRELSTLCERVLRHERKISAGMRKLPPVAGSALVWGLVVDEVVSTNDLEGVHSTRRQINDLLGAMRERPASQRSPRFMELAKLYLGISDSESGLPRTPEDIRAIYDQVMLGEELGDDETPDGKLFRSGGVDVIGHGGKVIHAGLEPEERIVETLGQMLSIMSSEEIPEVYSSVICHYLFEYIHPFYDGNGRTGRYLLALCLSRPLSVLTSLSLSRVIANHRDAYYRSFREAGHKLNHGELTHFVINILEDVREAQGELDTALTEKMHRFDDMTERFDTFCAGSGADLCAKEAETMFMMAQMELFAPFPDVTLSEVANHLGLSVQQTRRHTKGLEAHELIETVSKRPLRFVLTNRARRELGLPNAAVV